MSMTVGVQSLGQAILKVVEATEGSVGPMTSPDVDLTSSAYKELKLDASWGNPDTLEHPMYDVLSHLELGMYAMNDHLRSVGMLLGGEVPNWFGHIAVSRAVVETASRLWLLAEPQIEPVERVRRHLMERQLELNHLATLLGGPLSTLPEPLHDLAKDHANEQMSRLLGWSDSAGLDTSNGRLNGPRPGPTDLIVQVFNEEPAAIATGAPSALAAYHYNRLSSVAHGLPSGVATHQQFIAGGTGTAHNVLTDEDIAHTIQVALTCYDAAFDRLALFFRWPHLDLLPLRWVAIHAITALMPG